MTERKTDVIALKKRMIEKGFDKQASLCRASGICHTTLSSILSGKAQPSYDVMQRLVVALELSETEAGCIFFAPILHNA